MQKKILSLLLLSSLVLGTILNYISANAFSASSRSSKTYIANMKVFGDCLTHTSLYKAAYQEDGSYDFSMYFENLKKDISSADLAVINQETIFTTDKTKLSGSQKFASPTELGDAEAAAGFDVIIHSNNHCLDQGLDGIRDTLSFWRKNYPDIGAVGIHADKNENDIFYLWKKNIRFAFVAYTNSLNHLENELSGHDYMVDKISDTDIEKTIRRAKNNADITIAVLHIGKEYYYKPQSYVKKQVDRMIDAGADIVICNHPHVLNPYGKRKTSNGKTGIVFYSLGNYISNQKYIPRIISGMANLTIQKTVSETGKKSVKITKYSMTPLITHQEKGYYTTYKLSKYTEAMWQRHQLYCEEFPNVQSLKDYYKRVMSGKQRQSLIGTP